MSLIGMLEQLNLSSVLQRIETHTKTGLMGIKQGSQWVELYFQNGRLMCVGPVRTDSTLGERLLQDGVISSQALQEALLALGTTELRETRIALTLMDLGHVRREELRAWATQKVTEVVHVLLTWSTGEIYFEENAAPPTDRLLVSLSISFLLSSAAAANPFPIYTYSEVVQGVSQAQKIPGSSGSVVAPTPSAISQSPTLFEASQFFARPTESPLPIPASSLPTPSISAEALLPTFDKAVNASSGMPPHTPAPTPGVPAVPMTAVPESIAISFMRPEMVLVPADFSALRNQQVFLTPEQWRLLTCVDGHTSLWEACYALAMSPEQVCKIAAELLAQHVILLVLPASQWTPPQLSPVSQELVNSGLSNGYGSYGDVAMSASPWGGVMPPSDGLPQLSPALYSETQSQWGNGGNGTTFVPGRGWIVSPQPLQPVQSSGPMVASGSNSYIPVAGSQ